MDFTPNLLKFPYRASNPHRLPSCTSLDQPGSSSKELVLGFWLCSVSRVNDFCTEFLLADTPDQNLKNTEKNTDNFKKY